MVYKSFGKDWQVACKFGKYYENGNMAIQMFCNDDGVWEPFASLTVNLSVPCEENCAFVDTNNLWEADVWLVKNGYGEPTGRVRQSGWCLYPEFRFNVEKMCEDSYVY